MRVVAGQFRGFPLQAPRGLDTRPTSDRVREAVFSILASVDDLKVLDLFAGSGALALEALSRGAAEATLIDISTAAIDAINRNMRTLGVDAEVRRESASAFLERARTHGRQYDLVFVDPPYRQASMLGPQLSAALGPVLAAGARVVAESDKRDPLKLDLPLLTERRYGDTLISIHGT
ncbi:MAG: 16S rRNA (guanine(966)-N(2))-methyltransferase RsmD [Solirubrobacteraceae bacterium]